MVVNGNLVPSKQPLAIPKRIFSGSRMYSCRCCGTQSIDRTDSSRWWSLKNYYGLTGTFCSDCYNKVSHDSYGNPEHPEEYTLILLKIGS